MRPYRVIQRPPVPVDALRLNEDLTHLRQILRLLDWIDPYNVAEDGTKGRRMLRSTIGMIKQCERYADQKMRNEFLSPVKKKIQRNRTPVV